MDNLYKKICRNNFTIRLIRVKMMYYYIMFCEKLHEILPTVDNFGFLIIYQICKKINLIENY